MITKEEVKKIAVEFLDKMNISYSSLDEKISKELKKKIRYGKRTGENRDIYIYSFGQLWGLEERSMFLCLDVETGDVLYILGPHGPIYVVE